MRYKFKKRTLLIGLVILLSFQPIYLALSTQEEQEALSSKEVETIAKQITVKISGGQAPGSGVIIQSKEDNTQEKNGYVYTILTNCHVLLSKKLCEQGNQFSSLPSKNTFLIETFLIPQEFVSKIK